MGLKILIIDDNKGDRVLIETFLHGESPEYETFMAATGEEGVEKAKEIKPDIIVLDTRLPGIDGFETCKRIKAQGLEKTKIIILTGVVDAVDAGKARKVGADGYCVKTSDGHSLLEAIEEIVLNDPTKGQQF